MDARACALLAVSRARRVAAEEAGAGAQDYRFLWVELWSAEAERVYYFNQETQTTSWDRPVDLGGFVGSQLKGSSAEDHRSVHCHCRRLHRGVAMHRP